MSWFSNLKKGKPLFGGGDEPMPTYIKKYPTWCVPSAIFCATAWLIKQRQPVRIIAQHIEPGIDHVQAEGLYYGTWTPLTEMPEPDGMVVQTWTRHYPDIEPYRIMSLGEFFNEQYQIFKL